MMRAMPRAMPFAQVHSTRMCLLELLGDDLCERLKAPKQGRREIPCWAMLGCVGGYVGHPYTLPTCRFFSGVCVGRSYCWKPIASCRALIIPEEIYYLLFFFHGK